MMPQMVEAGMRIMRINFSHATFEEAELRMTNLKNSVGVDKIGDVNNLRAIMLDTKGPEIRTGEYTPISLISNLDQDHR